MKLCKVIDYCYYKNKINFGVGPTQNGQLAAILNFYCMTSITTSGVYTLVYAFQY